jgi:RNA-directed DNA polymerase
MLSLTERTVLRAIEQRYESMLEPEGAGSIDYQEMLEGPAHAGCPWVAVADVSAFFQYIDHGILADELIAQTGNAELADATSRLLHFLLNRSFGLPQGYRASDLFANVYIDAAVRRLLRRGRATWRHVDDFRLGADTANDARAALDELDEALRPIGLTLNGEKSYVFDNSTYGNWIKRCRHTTGTTTTW